MEIACESCGNSKWTMKLFEMRLKGQNIVYTALKCNECGINYPLQKLGKNMSKKSIANVLKKG